MIQFLLIPTILALTWAEKRMIESTMRVVLKPPPSFSFDTQASNVHTAWMTMPIDHFDPQNEDTYQMRFMYNEQFFGGPGHPIFILVGGEWDIEPGWLEGGNMFLMAQENRGFQIYTEHRFYGESLPYRNFTTENLRFLSVDQALADLAYFIKETKKDARFSQSKIILYGGSHAGNMVLWFKQRYPHLVVGGVASSAPILGKVDFTGYLEVVHDAFSSEGGQQCIATIRQGIDDTIAALSSEEGRLSIQETYRLCELNHDSEFNMGVFAGLITWTLSGEVQDAQPGTLTSLCNNFATEAFGVTPMQKIGGFIAETGGLDNYSCWNNGYESYLERFMDNNNERAWQYQTCTEIGNFQTAPRSGSAFDRLTWLNVPFFVDGCKWAFGPKFDEAFIHSAVDRVNLVFGGLNPDVDNIINIHGDVDPWHALGVHDRDLKDSSPTVTVNRASHCFDMSEWQPSDTIRMTNAQQFARRLVAQWLSE